MPALRKKKGSNSRVVEKEIGRFETSVDTCRCFEGSACVLVRTVDDGECWFVCCVFTKVQGRQSVMVSVGVADGVGACRCRFVLILMIVSVVVADSVGSCRCQCLPTVCLSESRSAVLLRLSLCRKWLFFGRWATGKDRCCWSGTVNNNVIYNS